MSRHLRDGSSSSPPQELRLLLLGNIGCGKTSSADTILGQSPPGPEGSPRSCQLRSGSFEDRAVTLVEAPRWFWSGGTMEDGAGRETARAATLLAPGPHCILLLVPVNQFTEMEGRVPAALEEMFGRESLDHTLVLLTCGDYLMGKPVEEYLQKDTSGLSQVIERCRGRYHVINNRRQSNREQVRELLDKVDIMVLQNGFMKTGRDGELEARRKDGKNGEPAEPCRAENVEKSETVTVASAQGPNTETQRSVSAGDVYSATLQRRRKQRRDEIEGRVGVGQVSGGLQATPAAKPESQPESQSDVQDGQLDRTPSFRLTADGAKLLEMSEVQPKKMISTFHHRINSMEEQPPTASPTASSPQSPVFSAHPPSSPTSGASAFSEPPSPSPSPPASPASSPSPELRLVLLGRSGAGKSAAGNVILGLDGFETRAVTQECEKKKALVGGRRVAVVDTPDWFTSESTPDEARAQISSCVALSSPGPHAFLLCVPVDEPAKLELGALWALDTVFGPEAVRKYTLVLFTFADRLRASGKAGGSSAEAYIAGQRLDLLNLVEKCGDRFHILETGDGGSERRNAVELLDKVEQMVKEAGGQSYSCPAFQEAESRVRQKQVEIARERRKTSPGQLGSKRRPSYMQSVAEEEVREDEIEETRDEAEMSVSAMNIESLPPIAPSGLQPSALRSVVDTVQLGARTLPKLLADGSEWAREGARQVGSSPVWGVVGSRAEQIKKILVDSPLWGKVGDRVPRVVVDGSTWVGSGAKAVAASPAWETVGSGARAVASGSVRVGAGIGTGAKALAQSPVWEKMGSGARAGAKMVAESPAWGKLAAAAERVPRAVIAGALLGLVLGLLLWGAVGGGVGAAAGAAATEAGRRKYRGRGEAGTTGTSRVDKVLKTD